MGQTEADRSTRASATPLGDSPERALIVELIAAGKRNVALDTNPAFSSVGTRLIEGKPGEVTVGFTVPASMTRGNDVVAGGALTTMLDTAMAVAVFTGLAPGQSCTSINFTVNMLSAARTGEFVAEGLVEKLGRRVCFASAKLYDSNKRLVATASSALAIVSA